MFPICDCDLLLLTTHFTFTLDAMALFFLLCWLLEAVVGVQAVTPFAMPWSDQTYGPDGPWHAVSVQLGSNRQKIDLYPGDRWASTIIINTLCSNKSLSSTCYAEHAGAFNINESDTAVTPGSVLWSASDKSSPIAGYRRQGVLADSVSFGPAVPNISMNAIYDAYQNIPMAPTIRFPLAFCRWERPS